MVFINKREKEILQLRLHAEEDIIAELEEQYKRALNDINRKIRLLMSDELTQSKIYQIEYQKALRGQIEGILEKLHGDEFSTIQKYLHDCYEDAFIGTVYDMAGQGIPLIMPIDQAAAVKAIVTDSKVSKGLYDALGVDVKNLKKAIRQEITRGISTAQTYEDIARNISEVSKAPISRAKTIARTEGHRIQQASTMDAQERAKAKGADVVKQWDSTLDGATRPTHRRLDGQIREVDEPFEADGKKAMYPGDFGDPAEDCNCRCASLTRARWGLDEAELQTLKDRAAYFGLNKTKDFEDFKEKYMKAAKTIEKSEKSGKMVLPDVKLSGYALNPAVAPDKAAAFKSALGYTAEHADMLKQNILDHIDEDRFVEKGDNGYGMRYEFIMELTGLNGKKANVLTAWIQDGEEKRLTSVYVTKRAVTK